MRRSLAAPFLLMLLAGCGAGGPTVQAEAPAGQHPQDVFFEHLSALCGQAFEGRLTAYAEADRDWLDQRMVMHVRQCGAGEIRIPLHVGEDRSRTWVVTRTPHGLRLKHDHRHADGSPDEINWYGGDSAGPGTDTAQSFPADEASKAMFVAGGIPQSVANVWSLELVPGERYSYVLRRPDRHFQADFDLTRPVPAPPAPWGAD